MGVLCAIDAARVCGLTRASVQSGPQAWARSGLRALAEDATPDGARDAPLSRAVLPGGPGPSVRWPAGEPGLSRRSLAVSAEPFERSPAPGPGTFAPWPAGELLACARLLRIGLLAGLGLLLRGLLAGLLACARLLCIGLLASLGLLCVRLLSFLGLCGISLFAGAGLARSGRRVFGVAWAFRVRSGCGVSSGRHSRVRFRGVSFSTRSRLGCRTGGTLGGRHPRCRAGTRFRSAVRFPSAVGLRTSGRA